MAFACIFIYLLDGTFNRPFGATEGQETHDNPPDG